MPHMERNNRTNKKKLNYLISQERDGHWDAIWFFYKIFLKVKFTLIIEK